MITLFRFSLAISLITGSSLCAAEDLLNAPPIVSAKSWAVARDGQVLFSFRPDSQYPIASLSKIMTALLVLESTTDLASKTKVSRRADHTFGTTASIQAGEKLSIEQLLHALLLPSGNDAAVVLAEYFGRSYQRQPGENFQTGFVNQMNERAKELALSNTIFVDPHGLGENVSSAADLLALSHTAMQNPRFARLVSTRQYSLNIRSPKGELRAVTWKNTNDLLALPYFNGIKTGHSNSAEGCLIISGSYRDDTLHVVVLGSLNQKTRFIDAQNLFQWALRQLAEADSSPSERL